MEQKNFKLLSEINRKLEVLLIEQKNEKDSIIRNYAKFKKGEEIPLSIMINYKQYVGLTITEVQVTGGYLHTNRGIKFHDYDIQYTIKPFGSSEEYVMYEDDLLGKLNIN